MILPSDCVSIALLKLDLLISCVGKDTSLGILRELRHYTFSPRPEIVREALMGIVRSAAMVPLPEFQEQCLAVLSEALHSPHGIPRTSLLRQT
jgi:hypothetical protein